MEFPCGLLRPDCGPPCMCKDVGVLRTVCMLGASVTVMGLKRGGC